MDTFSQAQKLIKGGAIGIIAFGTYNVIEQTTSVKLVESVEKKKKEKVFTQRNDDIVFSVILGLTQAFMPPIVEDETLQSVVINPLFSSFITTLYKDISGHKYAKGFPLRAYMSGVTASALITIPLDKIN